MGRKVPRSVWVLGLVSMFMDMSSEMAHAVLPLFLVGTLGASVSFVGVVDGLAEAFAQIVKVFSGALSDRTKSRKWLAVLGYGLSAFTKPMFPLAMLPVHVLAARLADRLGKGIRGSPRDAMVADLSSEDARGAAFGMRQALDTVGAVAGPLLAALLLWLAYDLRSILWLACLPALAAVAVLVLGVVEPARRGGRAPVAGRKPGFKLANPGRAFWVVLALGAAMSLARVSEAFLVLKASDAQLRGFLIPLVMVAMNAFYAASAYPAGAMADGKDSRGLLLAGMFTLFGADLVLAEAASPLQLFGGVALWGLHMGLTQGLLGKLVADASPPNLRGTCFGYFHFASGVATLLSNVVAGYLWDSGGARLAFYWSGGFAVLTAVLVVLTLHKKKATQG